MKTPATVICVLKTGGEYGPKHAARLYDQFLQHSPPNSGFLCLTDRVEQIQELEVPASLLRHDWPGWFAKLCVFEVLGPALYVDLDVNIVGDLTPLLDAAREHEFIMCRGFWGPEDPNPVNSSVMAWRGDASMLYEEFAAAPEAYMRVYSARERWGDQAFIRHYWHGKMQLWQDARPGMVLSYKRNVLLGDDWSNARVIASHGKPRPWESGGADEWLARKLRRM